MLQCVLFIANAKLWQYCSTCHTEDEPSLILDLFYGAMSYHQCFISNCSNVKLSIYMLDWYIRLYCSAMVGNSFHIYSDFKTYLSFSLFVLCHLFIIHWCFISRTLSLIACLYKMPCKNWRYENVQFSTHWGHIYVGINYAIIGSYNDVSYVRH